MTSTAGGIGRFSRKKAITPNEVPAPAPAPPVVTTESEETPTSANDVLPSTDSGVHGRAETFVNVDMFGGSFDMNFHTSSNEPSYEYDPSTFDSFGGAVGSEDLPLATESDTAPAPIGFNVSTVAETDPSQATTVTQQGSTVTQAVQEATNSTQFSSLGGKEPPSCFTPAENIMGATGVSTPLSSPKTSVPHPLGRTIVPAAGLSMFARMGEIANASAGINVLPPPCLQPSKPLPIQQDNCTASATPKGGIFLLGLSGGINSVATPSPRNGNSESNMGQKVLQSDLDTMLVTPEPANATVASPMEDDLLSSMKNQSGISSTSVCQDNAYATSLQTEDSEDDFDGLLSQFLSDLRADMDLLEKGDAELLDLEVALSEVFALTLSKRSEAFELLDGVEEAISEADRLIAEYTQLL